MKKPLSWIVLILTGAVIFLLSYSFSVSAPIVGIFGLPFAFIGIIFLAIGIVRLIKSDKLIGRNIYVSRIVKILIFLIVIYCVMDFIFNVAAYNIFH